MTVSDQIIQVLDNLCEKFGLAIDWTSENVIPYLTTLTTKLVSFEIWTSVAWLVILLVGVIIALTLIWKFRYSNFDIITPLSFVSIFFGAFAIPGCIVQIMDIIKCLTFPELFVFEYVQNLINAAH